jgi:hypothetical protein
MFLSSLHFTHLIRNAEAKIPITTMNWDRVDVFLKKSDVDSIIRLAMQIDNRYYDDDPNQKFFNHTLIL